MIQFGMGYDMSEKKKVEITDEEAASCTDEASEQEGATPEEAAVADLGDRLTELENELAVSRENYLRAVADLQNFRRRSAEERQQHTQFANEGLITELLPIVDNFARATGCEVDTDAARSLLRGVCMVEQQLLDVLMRFGVQRINTTDQFFDPAFHEAVERVETNDVCEGMIVGELQPGYTLNGRLLRPARVKVAVEPH